MVVLTVFPRQQRGVPPLQLPTAHCMTSLFAYADVRMAGATACSPYSDNISSGFAGGGAVAISLRVVLKQEDVWITGSGRAHRNRAGYKNAMTKTQIDKKTMKTTRTCTTTRQFQ